MDALRLRIELDDVTPPVWREIRVPGEMPLPQFHAVLQEAMGWENRHLHGFRRTDAAGHAEIWQDRPDLFDTELTGGPTVHDEAAATVARLLPETGARATYDYDFGDGWEHSLTVLGDDGRDDDEGGADPHEARVLAGERTCPPEDCGGATGFLSLLDSLERLVADPAAEFDQGEREKVDWFLGRDDPDVGLAALAAFDVGTTDARVRSVTAPVPEVSDALEDGLRRAAMVGSGLIGRMTRLARLDLATEPDAATCEAATAKVSWFLDLVGAEGLQLTQASYLRPADLRKVVERLEIAGAARATREVDAPEVFYLREGLKRLGLIRKLKGRLVRTVAGKKLADDPVALWEHLRLRLPVVVDDFSENAGLVVMLDLAGQEVASQEFVEQVDGLPPREQFSVASRIRSAADERLCDAVDAMGWSYDGDEIPGFEVRFAALETLSLLRAMGVLPGVGLHELWRPTGQGQVFLRAALRA